MNKSLSTLIYGAVWFVLMLVQTFVISAQTGKPSVFASPSEFYALWTIDLYLIALWYLNYHGLAPRLIHRRLFSPYIWLTVVAMVLGLLIPIILYVAFGWTLPGESDAQMPLSLFGSLGAVGIISISLAVRSIFEWIALDKELATLREQVVRYEAQVTEQATLIATLSTTPAAPSEGLLAGSCPSVTSVPQTESEPISTEVK